MKSFERFQLRACGLKDKDGHLLTNESQILKSAEYLKEILNRDPLNHADNEALSDDKCAAGEQQQPTKTEIKSALKALKNDKGPRKDNLIPKS